MAANDPRRFLPTSSLGTSDTSSPISLRIKNPSKTAGRKSSQRMSKETVREKKEERETQRCQVVPTPVTRVPLALSGQCKRVSVRSSRSAAQRLQGQSAVGRRWINNNKGEKKIYISLRSS